MTHLLLVGRRGFSHTPGDFGITPPVSPSLDEAILAHDPFVYYPFRSSLDGGLGDVMANVAMQIGAGSPLTGYPTICAPDTGDMLAFNLAGTDDRFVSPHNAAWNSLPQTIIVHGVSMDLGAKNILMARGTNQVGANGIELLADGRMRAHWNNDTGLIDLQGDAADIAFGESFGMALVAEPTGIRAYWKKAGGSIQAIAQLATIATPDFEYQITWAGYHTGAARFIGPMGRAAIFLAALTEEQIDDVLLPVNVTYARPIDVGTITAEEDTLVSVLDRAIYRGTPTVTIDGQPANSVFSVVGTQVEIATGATEGGDTGDIDIDGSVASLSFNVEAAASPSGDQVNLGQAIGSGGWGATAGNGPGVGKWNSSREWVFSFPAPLTGTFDRLRFNLPGRDGYFGGTGGIMRVTIRSDTGAGVPNMAAGGIVWQSQQFVFSSSGGKMNKHPDINYFYGFGANEGAELTCNAALTAGNLYHIVWTNEHGSPGSNWYSINHAFNKSLVPPYHPWPLWDGLQSMRGNTSGVFSVYPRYIPHFQLRRGSDALWIGQPYFDCGSTSNIMTLAGAGTTQGNTREIGVSGGADWQSRQRWQHNVPTMSVSRWRGRVWRRNSSTANPLRVRLEREESGGGVTTLADINIAASDIFETNYDNQDGQVFAPIDVSLGGSISLVTGEIYRLRLSSGSSTRYCMRAPNGYRRGDMNLGGWGNWPASNETRGEYSINGGATWAGMHMYGSNTDTCDWNMCLHDTATPGDLF